MNEIEKFLHKLDTKRRAAIESIISRVQRNDLDGFDLKKLRGRTPEYRIRAGSIRIKFERTVLGNIITGIGFRNDNTY
jgi:mRNA-degrading endonuclease RelE of RelBE toxin-antitoxin system